MLRPQRQHQRIVGRRRLELEVELAAEAFPERETPRFVDPASEWRMKHELHAAGFVEEPFEDERLLGRNRAERRVCVRQIGDGLLRRRYVAAGFRLQPCDGPAK